ncbi:MAG TPA: hypothetical protein DEV97_06025 [Lachnospiraceae bacterium]|nr:hypothetical protein [Lachnospiraceae bacterium]
MKLLMVNDAALELHTMEIEIPWKNYGIDTVFTAESAAQAREILLSQQVDLLMCDIEMPGEDGISLIRWIRQQKYDIECILLTCHSDFVYAKEAISLGCREYIVLPARYEDIGSTVQRVVGQRRELQHAIELQEYGRNWVQQHQEELQEEQKKQNAQAISPKETAEKCAAYIQEHLGDEDLNVQALGSVFYLNPIYLSRIFKREKGIAINQWITRQRMELAGRLLKDPGLSANLVAQHCGYANYPYFSTVFKSYYGCTPSQYAAREAPDA